jgi:hypothetical protein
MEFKMKILGLLIVSSIIVIVASYAAFLLYQVWPISTGNIDKIGAFGDSFGVLTALFSGLAFAGIILTILLQREELRLQRNELKLTRQELSTQNETSKLQSFENTFFQMLRVHNDLLASMDIIRDLKNPDSLVTSGRDCFIIFCDELSVFCINYKNGRDELSVEEVISGGYELFWIFRGQELAHYFRYLYTVFKFIEARAPDQRFYSKIVRAQLSNQEMVLLFYNCLTDQGNEKFKPLIEKFAIFNNLNTDELLEVDHKTLYGKGAYNWSN